MALRIHFPDDIEDFAAALDGISEATAQAAQDGPESLAAFRLGVRVALLAMVKTTGGQTGQPMKLMEPSARVNQLDRVTANPCPLKGIYTAPANHHYCRYYHGYCPLTMDSAYDYSDCPGWHNYETERYRNTHYA